MKVAFVYGPMSLGARPLDFARLYDDPRGLTGSELSCVEYARAMGKRGHDVTLYVFQDMRTTWLENDGNVVPGMIGPIGGGILVCGQDKIGEISKGWDAICVWNEPDILRGADPGAVRLVNQQLNDFTYCQPGWQDHVDMLTSPSQHHMTYLKGLTAFGSAQPDRWRVLPNGCDPSLYTDGRRVPGRVLWASSPDRGLHLLLQAWPSVRERVPHATLHALYNFAPGPLLGYEEGSIGLNGLPVTPDIQELARRYRYIQHAMVRLQGMGVLAIGSVSRNRVVQEMDEAVVLGYPCDTIRYTEGFSVTTMEACAAGVIPIITAEDALPSIYKGAAVILPTSPSAEQVATAIAEWLPIGEPGTQLLSGRLKQGDMRKLAAAHAWPVLAERLESILLSEREKKRAQFVQETSAKALAHLPTPICTIPAAERGPYEVEGNPVPEGARLAEWYVNHHYYGHKTMRYWTTWDIMVGGTIYDKAEWEYLKRRYALTHIINVESEHTDEGKDTADKICEAGRQVDDASPRQHEGMIAVLDFAAKAYQEHPAPKFYVHCQMGGSRSPAFAYLLLRGLHNMSRKSALTEIHRTRPEYAGPVNPGHHLAYLASADAAAEDWRLQRHTKGFGKSCKLCEKACERWQVFCGAACCARWEAEERPEAGTGDVVFMRED